MSGSTKELKNLSRALEESHISLQLSSKLLCLNRSFELLNKYKEEKRYIESAKTLKTVETILNEPHSELAQLNIYPPLRDAYCQAYGTFVTTISLLWEEQVSWQDIDGKNGAKLTITPESNDLQNLIQALHHVENLPISLHEFSNKLMKHFIGPIIKNNCSVFVIENDIFNVEIIDKKNKLRYDTVLHNLKLLFQFIYQHLNIVIEDNCFLSMLGNNLLKQFSKDLLENCIADTIPSSSKDLLSFTPVKEHIYNFENYLIEIGNQFFLFKLF